MASRPPSSAGGPRDRRVGQTADAAAPRLTECGPTWSDDDVLGKILGHGLIAVGLGGCGEPSAAALPVPGPAQAVGPGPADGGGDHGGLGEGGEHDGVTVAPGGEPSSEFPRCGDGRIDAGEECDDGNAIDGDGCNTDCSLTCLFADDFDGLGEARWMWLGSPEWDRDEPLGRCGDPSHDASKGAVDFVVGVDLGHEGSDGCITRPSSNERSCLVVGEFDVRSFAPLQLRYARHLNAPSPQVSRHTIEMVDFETDAVTTLWQASQPVHDQVWLERVIDLPASQSSRLAIRWCYEPVAPDSEHATFGGWTIDDVRVGPVGAACPMSSDD